MDCEEPYLLLPTDSWESEAIVGCYPLDSLEVVDSEADINIISRIVDNNFGYSLFLGLSVPIRFVPVPIMIIAWINERCRSVTSNEMVVSPFMKEMMGKGKLSI